MKSDLKSKLLAYLADGVKTAQKEQDKQTGKFLTSNGGWAVTRQDVIFPMAMLYTTEGTEWYGKKSLLNMIKKGGNALRSEQDSEGRWEFIKPDGSKWGKTLMPWTIYHWTETYALLKDELDSKTRKSWEQGLVLCYEGLAEAYREPVSHNIPTWDGMSLMRGSQVFHRPAWAEVGRNQCHFSAAHQHKNGYWPEGDGPTNGYNTIYVHALGLYYAFTKDRKILKCLERASAYHSVFTYPDGSSVETVDGRMKYASSPRVSGWPGFSLFPQGRRLVELAAKKLMSSGEGTLTPHIASYIQHGEVGPAEPLAWEKDERTVYARKALIRRHGSWFACVSGYNTPPESRTIVGRNRWIMTRSNCLSVWHRELGLLIGGGNSKHDPLFSTFDVGEAGSRRLEPDAVSFEETAKGERIRFRYGSCSCLLYLNWKNSKTLEITFDLPTKTRKNADVQACFTMKLKEGSSFAWESSGGKLDPVTGKTNLDAQRTTIVHWGEPGSYKKRVVTGEGWSLMMPDESSLYWPAYPFNPYAIDNAAPAKDAVASVSAGFSEGSRRTFVLRVD